MKCHYVTGPYLTPGMLNMLENHKTKEKLATTLASFCGPSTTSQLVSVSPITIYSTLNYTLVIILINLCVAMMDSRMGKIIGDRESIWKFYRTDVWMIFIGDRSLPVPFNIVSCLLDKILMLVGKNSAGTYQKETVKYELFFKIDSCTV